MAHLNTLAAAMFTDLSLSTVPLPQSMTMAHFERMGIRAAGGITMDGFAGFQTPNSSGTPATLTTTALSNLLSNAGTLQSDQVSREAAAANFKEFVRISNIKEFPAVGTPANIVKVPEYGEPSSKQINAQSDANNMELTINFVPSLWKDGKLVGPSGATLTGLASNNFPAIGDGNRYLFRFALLAKDPTNANASALGYNSAIEAEAAVANFSASAPYTVGQLVVSDGGYYSCLAPIAAASSTTAPQVNPTQWALIAGDPSLWVISTAYPAGTVVRVGAAANKEYYRCNTLTPGTAGTLATEAPGAWTRIFVTYPVYPTSFTANDTALTMYNLGAVANSIYYFIGKLEALEVTASLTDAATAKLTISIQSAISGAWTEGALI